MSVIVIASIVTAIGTALGLFLTHRLVGFRASGPRVMAALPGTGSPDFAADEITALVTQIRQLQSEIARMHEQMHERELMDEYRWRELEDVQTEVQQVRRATFELEVGLEKRLRRLGESRDQRERDRERFGRRREREHEESTWHERTEPEPVA